MNNIISETSPLAQAGNLFSGVKPIPELQCERFGMKSDILVRELVTKQVMMESSIKKVLDKSVAIQDSPSLQAFLTSIGFIGAKGGGGGGDGGSGGALAVVVVAVAAVVDSHTPEATPSLSFAR
jgi:Flp pilus assembly CpaE family ATPase